MTALSHVCPHCMKESVFTLDHQRRADEDSWWLMLDCPGCRGAAVALVQCAVEPRMHKADLRTAPAFALHAFHPELRPVEAPAMLPDDLTRLFMQAAECRRNGMRDAAAMTYSKTLDVALAKSGEPKGPLGARIDSLATRRVITDSMRDWAHEVRLEGNVAAHEAEAPDAHVVDQLHFFVELLLTYLFTMPAMVAARRAAR